MANKKEETTAERLARMKKEQEAAKAGKDTELVGQLTHTSDGEPDFAAIAEQLKAQSKKRADKGANEDYVKMTLYVEKDVAAAFRALASRHGLQKEYTNEALKDFIKKKSRELGIQE